MVTTEHIRGGCDRLVLCLESWRRCLQRVILEQVEFGLGALRWNTTRLGRELICDRVVGVSREEIPDQRGPVLLVSPDIQVIEKIAEQRIRARATTAWLSTVNGDNSRWECRVWDQQVLMTPAEVHFVGPGMIRLRTVSDTTVEPTTKHVRFSRTDAALTPAVGAWLRQSSVAIVGAGRTGSLAATHLAAMGCHVRVVDPDVLQPWNLDAMPAITEADVGQPKVTALAQAIQRMGGRHMTGLAHPVNSRLAYDFLRQRSQLIITCVDSDLARLAVAIICRRMLIPHMDIGVSLQRGEDRSIDADARLLIPPQACVACTGEIDNLETLLRDLRLPPDAIPTLPSQPWNRQRAGSLVSVNGMIVGAALQIWFDFLENRIRGSYWQRMSWRPDAGLESDFGPVRSGQDCGICSGKKSGIH